MRLSCPACGAKRLSPYDKFSATWMTPTTCPSCEARLERPISLSVSAFLVMFVVNEITPLYWYWGLLLFIGVCVFECLFFTLEVVPAQRTKNREKRVFALLVLGIILTTVFFGTVFLKGKVLLPG